MNSWVIRCSLLLALLGTYWMTYQHGRSVELAARQEEQRRALAQGEA